MIKCYTREGKWHSERGVGNQDYCYYRDCEDYLIAVVTDGIGGSADSAVGAQTTAIAAVDYIERYVKTNEMFGKEKISFLLVEQICNCLTKVAFERNVKPEALASTLLLCCFDKNRKRASFYQLGDSVAVFIADGICRSIGLPPRVSTHGCPSTMTTNAYKAVRFFQMDFHEPGTIMLCSDGVIMAGKDPMEGTKIREAICGEDMEALAESLSKCTVEDDCTFISFEV